MKTKMTCIAILWVFGFLTAIASADQSYRFTLNSACKIGNEELRPGDYKLIVDEQKVVLIDLNTGKSIEVQAKVENMDKKFGTTEVHSKQVDGAKQISEIWIGGSKTKIAFE